MGNMVEHIQVTELNLDTLLYPRRNDGVWEGPWNVEGILTNGEGILVLWNKPNLTAPKGPPTYTEWEEYHFETVFDSSQDGWEEQEQSQEANRGQIYDSVLAQWAYDEGARLCAECGGIIKPTDTCFLEGGDPSDRDARVFHDEHAPKDFIDEAIDDFLGPEDGDDDDRETAHAQTCETLPPHTWMDCVDEPPEEAWKITLLVTSKDPEWTDSDLPRFFGPLKVFAFAEAVEGSGEGFAEAMTLDEAEELRL